MQPFRFIVQDGQKAVDWETQSQIKTHAMLNHLRRRANEGVATQDHVSPEPSRVALDSRTQGHFEVFKVKTLNKTQRNRREPEKSDPKSESWIPTEERSRQSLVPSLTDIAGYCGTYSFEGIPKELSDRIVRALQYRKKLFFLNILHHTNAKYRRRQSRHQLC